MKDGKTETTTAAAATTTTILQVIHSSHRNWHLVHKDTTQIMLTAA